MAGDTVQQAMRLGWAMAEVHGRNRLGDNVPIGTQTWIRGRSLPLASERTPAEQRIEAEGVLAAMAGGALGVDPLAVDIVPTAPAGDVAGKRASQYLTDLAKKLAAARKADSPDAPQCWNNLAELLYKWDAFIQDTFAAGEFGSASAYQLGRGLAEAYWALDPTAGSSETASWQFLLGSGRCDDLNSLIRRLSASMPQYTPDALTASLSAWHDVAADPSKRQDARAMVALRQQIAIWRDLLLTGYKPDAVIPSDDRLDRASRIGKIIQAFMPELVTTVIALLLLTGALLLIGSGNHIVGALLSVFSLFGVTTAGVTGKIKSTAQDLVTQLGDALNEDGIIAAATVLPSDLPLLPAPAPAPTPAPVLQEAA